MPNLRIKSLVPKSLRRTLSYSRQTFDTLIPWNLRLLLRGGGVKFRRRCIVLGSSPNPHPAHLDNFDLICVNSSGFVAREMGLPEPRVTILSGFKLVKPTKTEDLRALVGLRTEYLLLITHPSNITVSEAENILKQLDFRYRHIRAISLLDRTRIIREVTGQQLGGEDGKLKISNGLFSICYALASGAPEVVVSAMSLTKDGHYYSNQNRLRAHALSDKTAIIAIRQRGWPVKTSEPELSELTGLPLV